MPYIEDPEKHFLQDILQDAEKIRRNPSESRYALFVYNCMTKINKVFLEYIEYFSFPQEYPFFGLVCIIPAIERSYEFWNNAGVPLDVIQNNLCHFEECIVLNEERLGYRGLDKRYFEWLQCYVAPNCTRLNIDRLRFDIARYSDPVYLLRNVKTKKFVMIYGEGKMKEDGLNVNTPPKAQSTFTCSFQESENAYVGTCVLENGRCSKEIQLFDKKEYELVLKPKDWILSVHIPPKSKGEFNKKICLANYVRALEIFKTCFPDRDVKAFFCFSWMLSEELKPILKPESNILLFQEDYIRYPKTNQGDSVFNFVFKKPNAKVEDLPEQTSLQRAMKKIYLDGGYVYDYAGVFTVDYLKERMGG